jgi:hypothetical protein
MLHLTIFSEEYICIKVTGDPCVPFDGHETCIYFTSFARGDFKANKWKYYVFSERNIWICCMLLMLDGVTWTDRKIWSLRSAEYVGRWKKRGRQTREGRYNVKAERFSFGVNSRHYIIGNFGKEGRTGVGRRSRA